MSETKTNGNTWTPERRELQRRVAKRLHAEGRFGAPQPSRGRGGRPKKRAPSATELLAVIEHALQGGTMTWLAAREVLLGRRAVAELGELIGIDRSQFESLLVVSVEATVRDRQLPASANRATRPAGHPLWPMRTDRTCGRLRMRVSAPIPKVKATPQGRPTDESSSKASRIGAGALARRPSASGAPRKSRPS